jgi:hypothetical protein
MGVIMAGCGDGSEGVVSLSPKPCVPASRLMNIGEEGTGHIPARLFPPWIQRGMEGRSEIAYAPASCP